MFTGIITHLGKLKKIEQSRYTFSTNSSFITKLGKGSSVSVNGICLTVITQPISKTFSVEVMPETVRRTMIGTLRNGDFVNLELPMFSANLFAGHIVSGHIDGTGIITSVESDENCKIFRFKVDKKLSKYTIEKGSVAVNGISLTIIKAHKDFFTVGIIPFTWSNTMLRYSTVGGLVNIEVDVIAKYVEKFVSLRKE